MALKINKKRGVNLDTFEKIIVGLIGLLVLFISTSLFGLTGIAIIAALVVISMIILIVGKAGRMSKVLLIMFAIIGVICAGSFVWDGIKTIDKNNKISQDQYPAYKLNITANESGKIVVYDPVENHYNNTQEAYAAGIPVWARQNNTTFFGQGNGIIYTMEFKCTGPSQISFATSGDDIKGVVTVTGWGKEIKRDVLISNAGDSPKDKSIRLTNVDMDYPNPEGGHSKINTYIGDSEPLTVKLKIEVPKGKNISFTNIVTEGNRIG